MRWWKKGILFFLSSCWLIACDTNVKEAEIDSSKEDVTALSVVAFFVETDEINARLMDSLVLTINQTQNELTGYAKQNAIDNGNWLISAKEKVHFDELVALLSSHEKVTFYGMGELQLWRITAQNKRLREVSLSPHPTAGYILLLRIRDQE
jgi:hypothetical protein